MTRRDEFAKAAMVALISNPAWAYRCNDIVRVAWEFADGMIKANEQQQ